MPKITNVLDFNGFKGSNLGSPTLATDVATKGYVDSAINGMKWKESVRVATVANITLSGFQTIDGVALAADDRVLVKNQTTASQNGVYLVKSGSWVRATDFNDNNEVLGAAVFVLEGATHARQQWVVTTPAASIALGTDPLTFQQIGGSGSLTAGTGVLLNGTTVEVDTSVVARKAGATIGDGATTSFSIVHNLNTTDPVVSVRDVTMGAAVLSDWTVLDANTVVVVFGSAPALGQYRVSVVG